MLERVDRVLLAVRDAATAARTFASLLGTEVVGQAPSVHLGARRTILALGESEVELCEPTGPGPVRAHLDRWGEGLLAAGFAVRDTAAAVRRLGDEGAVFVEEDGRLHLDAAVTPGVPVVLSPAASRPRIGAVDFLYEVTNTLVGDWRAAAARYVRLFGLDEARFSPIESARFGYVGTLALFAPPARLDRIELSQVVDPRSAMGRWVARRGDSLYMCYVECADVPALVERLRRGGGRYTPRGGDAATERDGLWVHPASLHGLLLGVSRTTLAWEWSGRPALVRPA